MISRYIVQQCSRLQNYRCAYLPWRTKMVSFCVNTFFIWLTLIVHSTNKSGVMSVASLWSNQNAGIKPNRAAGKEVNIARAKQLSSTKTANNSFYEQLTHCPTQKNIQVSFDTACFFSLHILILLCLLYSSTKSIENKCSQWSSQPLLKSKQLTSNFQHQHSISRHEQRSREGGKFV